MAGLNGLAGFEDEELVVPVAVYAFTEKFHGSLDFVEGPVLVLCFLDRSLFEFVFAGQSHRYKRNAVVMFGQAAHGFEYVVGVLFTVLFDELLAFQGDAELFHDAVLACAGGVHSLVPARGAVVGARVFVEVLLVFLMAAQKDSDAVVYARDDETLCCAGQPEDTVVAQAVDEADGITFEFVLCYDNKFVFLIKRG